MSWPNQVNIDDVKQEIIEHLKTNPKAQDTFDGVVEWWLVRNRVRKGIDLIKAALSELEKEGSVIRTRSTGNVEIFKAR